jgi:GTP cyclohydrolase I
LTAFKKTVSQLAESNMDNEADNIVIVLQLADVGSLPHHIVQQRPSAWIRYLCAIHRAVHGFRRSLCQRLSLCRSLHSDSRLFLFQLHL